MIIIIAVVFICISEIRQITTINNAPNNASNIQEKFIIDPDSDTGQIDLSFLKDEPKKKETRKQHENSGGFPEKYRDKMINPPNILSNPSEMKTPIGRFLAQSLRSPYFSKVIYSRWKIY